MKKMVKEILVALIAAIVVICLSGCARVNYEVNVNKDGSADVSYVMGYDKEFLNSMGVSEDDLGEDAFEDMKKDATDDGYQIEEYNDDQIAGFKASKHFDKMSDFKLDGVANAEVSTEEANNEISFNKMLLDTKISQNAKLDLTEINSSDEDSEVSSITNMLLGQMKFTYKVTLPFKASDNNATTVSEDGKTLEWTLTPGEVNEVRFEATENLNTIVLACVVAAVAIVVVIIVVIGMSSKKKISKKEVKVAPKKPVTTSSKKQEVKKEETTTKKDTKKEDVKPAESKKTKTTEKKKEEPKKDKE